MTDHDIHALQNSEHVPLKVSCRIVARALPQNLRLDPGPSQLVVKIPPPPDSESSSAPVGQFDGILRSERGALMRSRLEAKYVDAAFAAPVEERWRTYFAARPQLSLSSMECRATLCAVRVVGIGMDKRSLQMTLLNPRDLPYASEVPGQRLIKDPWIVAEDQGSSPAAVVYYEFGSPPAMRPKSVGAVP
jgi:hypothetical protein